jgi:hypothetical protein
LNASIHTRVNIAALVALVMMTAAGRELSVAAQQPSGEITSQDLVKGLADPTVG